MPLTESDKVTLVKIPPLPSRCCICNFSADGERDFVDFQMSLDIYGAVSICVPCMQSSAELLSLVPVADLDQAQAEVLALNGYVESLKNEVRRLDSALTAVLDVRPNSAVHLLLDDKDAEGTESDSGEDDSGSEDGIEREESDDSDSSESDSSSGPSFTGGLGLRFHSESS